MTIPFTEVGLIHICPNCDHKSAIKPIERSRLLEQFIAKGLEARVLPKTFSSIDISESRLLPNLTFQVKASWKPILRRDQMTFHWRFYERCNVKADWYICFGALEYRFHLFIFPRKIWEKRRSQGRRKGDAQFVVQVPTTPIYNTWAWRYEITKWPEQFLKMARGRQQLEMELRNT